MISGADLARLVWKPVRHVHDSILRRRAKKHLFEACLLVLDNSPFAGVQPCVEVPGIRPDGSAIDPRDAEIAAATIAAVEELCRENKRWSVIGWKETLQIVRTADIDAFAKLNPSFYAANNAGGRIKRGGDF